MKGTMTAWGCGLEGIERETDSWRLALLALWWAESGRIPLVR